MGLPELIDTHCHLTYGDLEADGGSAWERARAAGVVQAVVVGVDAANSRCNVEFVRGRPGLSAAVGIHPNDTGKAGDVEWNAIAALAAEPEVAAIGESGLDFYRDSTPPRTQEAWLERHAALAIERDLPLILHVRDAFPRIREVLAGWAPRGLRAVLHCFGGAAGDIHPFVSWGFMVSFSGILTYPNAREIRLAAGAVPLHQCLVETDAPWLAPQEHRGKRNEPAFVVYTARRLAEVKGLPFEDLAAAVTANARRFFRLPPVQTT